MLSKWNYNSNKKEDGGSVTVIGGVEGGCMIEHKNDFGQVYEVLFIDTLDESTAMNCLRINNAGIGFSNTGPNGEFTQALAIDGGLSNEWISTWQLTADIINAGILKSKDVVLDENGVYQSGTFFLDLSHGILNMEASSLRIGGKSLSDAVVDVIGDNIDETLMNVIENKAEDIASLVAKKQSQEDVFNALTGGGKNQGLYIENGKVYLNMEYAKSGTISADLIDVANLMLSRIFSRSGSKNSYVEMLDNGLNFWLCGKKSIGIGFTSADDPLPYIVFGGGIDSTKDTNKLGLIKMYANGIWIGDGADLLYGEIALGTGFFIDTQYSRVFRYDAGVPSEISDSRNVVAIFG